MIIDGHVHIADSPDVGGFGTMTLDGPTLVQLMDGPFYLREEWRRVDMALTQPMITPTRDGDPLDHHRYIIDQVASYPDRLMGCFVANPLLDPQRTISVMRELVTAGGFKAMKLHPTGHGYMPFKTVDRLRPLLDAARDLEIPVIVHQGDPPFGHPSQLTALIEEFRTVQFVLGHFATQRVVLADEAIYVARQNENVYIETGWGALPRIKEGIAAIGPHRFIFGSDCPVQEIGSQLRPLEVLMWEKPMGIDLDRRDAERIMGGNLAELLRLEDRSHVTTDPASSDERGIG